MEKISVTKGSIEVYKNTVVVGRADPTEVNTYIIENLDSGTGARVMHNGYGSVSIVMRTAGALTGREYRYDDTVWGNEGDKAKLTMARLKGDLLLKRHVGITFTEVQELVDEAENALYLESCEGGTSMARGWY